MEKLTRNNIILLGCLVGLVLFFPLLSLHRLLILKGILSAVVFSGIYSCAFQKRTRRILLLFGTTAVIFTWLDIFFTADAFKAVSSAAIFAFLVAIVFFLVRHIARSVHVTATIILSAINGYLLLGLLGALSLAVADIAGKAAATPPASAINFAGGAATGFHDYLYFSFVTLTTLGYGDITPVSAAAKSIALIIGVCGQFYLTILVAMLVGKFLSQK